MRDHDRLIKDAATVVAIIKYLLIAGIIGLIIYYGSLILVVLLPFAVGLILARSALALSKQWLRFTGFMRGQLRFSQRRPQPRPGLAPGRRSNRTAIVFYYLLVVALFAALFGLIAATIGQLRSLVRYLPDLIQDTSMIESVIAYLTNLSIRFGGLLSADAVQMVQRILTDLQERLLLALPGAASTLLNGIGRFIGSIPAIIIAVVVILMSGHYFVADSRSIYKFIARNINNRQFVRRIFLVIHSLSNTLFRVIGGYVLLLFITFAEALLGLSLIGMPFAVILALVAAILDFLPILGISATMVPIILYLFINGNIVGAIGAIITLAVISVVRRFIEPSILGNALKLHPMATLFSMILGVAAYGLAGIFVGPVVLVIVREIFIQFGFDRQLRTLLGKLLSHVGEQPHQSD